MMKTFWYFLLAALPFNLALAQDFEIYYCPKQIYCAQDNTLSSCSYTDDSSPVWGKMDNGLSPVSKGRYKFIDSVANYHANWLDSVSCTYSFYENEPVIGLMTLYSKPEANLEVFATPESSWLLFDDFGSCWNVPNTNCPLKEQTAVFFVNESDLVVHVEGNSRIMSFGPNENAKIRYEQLGHCNEATTCSFNLTSQGETLGTITIDLDARMKIISLNGPADSPYQIEKIDNFNAIKITGASEPTRSKITLINRVGSSIMAEVNHHPVLDMPIPAPISESHEIAQADIPAQTVGKNCESDECIVVVRTESGMNLGTIHVSMNGPMNIISVSSTRPNEVILVKETETSVRVLYPFISKN